MLKRTPLFEAHRRAGARLIDFGGWEMPVQYSSIVQEHLAVRSAAGIFDISHMGEFRASGPGAKQFLNRLLTNDVAKLSPGLGQYTLLCNPQGGVIDDLYLYQTDAEEYLLIVNASRIEPDWNWFQTQLDSAPEKSSVHLKNESDTTAAVAIQGPKTLEFIDSIFSGAAVQGIRVNRPSELKKNEIAQFNFGSGRAWVARTGYTGEQGFEVVLPNAQAESLWDECFARGRNYGLVPAGLGARDTLRTEVCYPLYGHELDEQTTPIEAGLGFFVALEKGDFIGRTALANQKEKGIQKKCVAFKMVEPSAPPRAGYSIFLKGGTEPIGKVVSGTLSPSLNVGIGLGYVPTANGAANTDLEIEIRTRRFAARVVPRPIFKKTA